MSKIFQLDVEGEEWGDSEEDVDPHENYPPDDQTSNEDHVENQDFFFLMKNPIILCILWMKVLKIRYL
jgi:hypothetical protein